MDEHSNEVYQALGSEQHVYHHTMNDGPRVNMKVEKNTKGFNWEVTVTGAASVDQAIGLIVEAETQLAAQYGAALN